MKILRFTLSGKQAFFKKPEVNSHYYFTYGHIHKVALQGMFGAILGYGGYAQQTAQYGNHTEVPDYPEFYEKLQNIKVSVIPVCEKGNFSRKIVNFNNSVGYASQEQGGNLIIRQQWLEHPKWYVYVAVDSEETEKLADSMLHRICVYLPYLGSNDHMADIEDVAILNGVENKDVQQVDSLFPKEQIMVDVDDYEQENPFKYEEALPCGLDRELNQYVFQRYVLTNMAVTQALCVVYEIQDVNQKKYNITFY